MSDRIWIRGIRRGESSAFEALYAAYRRRVFRYACSLSGSVSVADDLLQEAFLGLLRNVDAVDDRQPLLPYLLKSVQNRWIDRRRSFEERRRPLPPNDVCEPSRDDPLERLEQIEETAHALDQLPEPQSQVVRLKVYGELSYEEIGQKIQVPAATVRSRYRAALGALRLLLGRRVQDV